MRQIRRRAGNPSWVSRLTNPFAPLFAEQQDVFTSGRPRGLSFMAEGLYMNLRGDPRYSVKTSLLPILAAHQRLFLETSRASNPAEWKV